MAAAAATTTSPEESNLSYSQILKEHQERMDKMIKKMEAENRGPNLEELQEMYSETWDWMATKALLREMEQNKKP